MAKQLRIQRTKTGKVDKRTKDGKELLERLAKARAARAKEKKGFFSFLFGKKKKK
jgi:hypothetical protein